MYNEVRHVLFFAILACSEAGSPVVQTSQGVVRGQTLKSRNGRDYASFTRIPFAKPPVGSLRFMAPEPSGVWEGELDGTEANTPCYQNPLVFTNSSEDCLYLDVYSPNVKGSMPVMFNIFGGAFFLGFQGPKETPAFFMDEEVVIVSTNYRLGSLGFLSLDSDKIPGNMGLKDMALALEWTKREIGKFGGNPDLITAFGISAGGASAHYLCSSPRTRGLLKGCISQSGVGGSLWSLWKPWIASLSGYFFAMSRGCLITWDVVGCLQNLPVEKLIADSGVSFRPVIEGARKGTVIPWWPPDDTNFPWMRGHTVNEGVLLTGDIEAFQKDSIWITILIKLKNYGNFLSNIFKYLPYMNHISSIYNRFFKDEDLKKGLEKMTTEMAFVYPALKELSRHNGPKYLYVFNYSGGPTFWEIVLHRKLNVTGICHGDDAPYFLNDPLITTGPIPSGWPSGEDVKFSKNLVKMWVNFAAYQNPTSGGHFLTKWREYDESKMYLDLANDGFYLKKYEETEDIIDFWNHIF